MAHSDYAAWYAGISAPYRARSGALRVLLTINKALVFVFVAAYLGCLIWLAVTGDSRLIRAVAVPVVEFALCTIIRSATNKPRPYEEFSIDPLIQKNTHGKSFPSRHTSSAVIIACTLCWLDPLWGAVAFAASVVECYCRIVGGIHYPRDIAGAVALALACALVGFVLIP